MVLEHGAPDPYHQLLWVGAWCFRSLSTAMVFAHSAPIPYAPPYEGWHAPLIWRGIPPVGSLFIRSITLAESLKQAYDLWQDPPGVRNAKNWFFEPFAICRRLEAYTETCMA